MSDVRGSQTGDSDRPSIANATEGLKSLGLTDYEVRVYLAILQRPASRIPEISRASEVPQPKVYPTVKRLLERGLLESELGPVNTYNALAPKDSFAPLLEDLERRKHVAGGTVEQLQEEFDAPGDAMGAREGRIKLFKGKQAIRRNFLELIERSEISIYLVARLPLVINDDNSEIQKAIERGVEVKLLVEAPKGSNVEADPHFLSNHEVGVHQRRLEKVPMRLGLFDERVSILPMLDSARRRDSLMMLEVRNEGLSEGLTGMFNLLWNTATPLLPD